MRFIFRFFFLVIKPAGYAVSVEFTAGAEHLSRSAIGLPELRLIIAQINTL